MGKYAPYDKRKTINCEDTGEVVSGDCYLSSRHWKQKRKEAYYFYKGQCQRCGDYIQLSVANIHHRTYKNMGKEKMTDLILYCNRCHRCIHNGRKQNRSLNGDIHNLIAILTPKEKAEAFNLLVYHFKLDYSLDLIQTNPKHKLKSKHKPKGNP